MRGAAGVLLLRSLCVAVMAGCVPRGWPPPSPEPDPPVPGTDASSTGTDAVTPPPPPGNDSGCPACWVLPQDPSCQGSSCGDCLACGDGVCDPGAGEDCLSCTWDCPCFQCSDPCVSGWPCCGDLFGCDPAFSETCTNCADCSCGTQSCAGIYACALVCLPVGPGEGIDDCFVPCYEQGCPVAQIEVLWLFHCMAACGCGDVASDSCANCVETSCSSELSACGSSC
jgi:hypothetical protein